MVYGIWYMVYGIWYMVYGIDMYLCIPILPGLWICPGMIPILHSPGLMIPGQLGPINLVLHPGSLNRLLT